MSKERAKRRAEREAAAAVAASRAQRRERRLRVLTAPLAPVRALRAALRRPGPNTRPAGARPAADSALRRKRSRENGLLLSVLLALNVVVWLMRQEWGWRVSFLVLSVLLWPVLGVLVFDRRPSR